MSRIARRLGATSVLAAFALISTNVLAEVAIIHDLPEEVRAGVRVTLQAEVEDEAARVELVRACFRAGVAQDYVLRGAASVDRRRRYARLLRTGGW